MSVLTGLVVPIATYIGLKAVGSNPVVKAVGTGVALVKIVDAHAASSAELSVRNLYRNADGSDPPILLLSEHEPSKARFSGAFMGKDALQAWVDKQGGTAWVQVGANGRMLYLWHPSRTFKLKDGSSANSAKLSLGHVVRGRGDAK